MKVASFTNNSQSFVKYGDTSTHLYVQISEDGTFVDLTQGQKIAVPIGNDSGLILTKSLDPTTMEDSDSGIVDINLTADDEKLLTPDDYYLEIWVTNPDGTIGIYPAAENQLQFEITDNLILITGDTVPAVALTDFESKFEELQQQVEDSIKNGLKGNDGEKGDTGNGIKTVKTQYQLNSSATVMPTGDWSDSIQQMTDDLPNLWVKLISTFTDNTTQTSYFVSSKGSKGEKGDTGLQGLPGPQGKGLVVRGKVDDISKLPTTGNVAGDGYFVGTDLYIWVDGKWENMGDISPDLSNYTTVTDLNNGLSTKVTDNQDGTEQLNGVKVQPFNKLSDSVGGRNLLINTAQLNDSTVCLDRKSNISDTYLGLNIYQTNSRWNGVRIYWSYLVSKIKTNTNYVMSEYVRNTSPTTSVNIGIYGADAGVAFNSNINYFVATLPPNSGWTRISAPVNITSFPTTVGGALRFENTTSLTDGYVQFAGFKLEQGSVATNWTPAPEDKVNVSDMRKPASDVAGIEEVNAKQDKIGYTPADDSKVAHLSGTNNFDTVPTVKNNPLLLASSLPSDLARTGSDQEFTGKNTFDTAPIDKATGNPYITKSGVPAVSPTLADTTKDANFTGKLQKSGIDVATKSDVTTAVSTATANMVDYSKPTNFTAGLKSGGVDVATAADLKSLEASAWRQLDNKYIIPPSGYTLAPSTSILYRIDDSAHKLYLSGSIALTLMLNAVSVTIQLGSIIKSILTLSVTYIGYHDVYSSWEVVHPTQSGTNLTFLTEEGGAGITGTSGANGELSYVTYDELV